MNQGLRIVLASYGLAQFEVLSEALTALGHVPIAYLASRSMRPSAYPEPDIMAAIQAIVSELPLGMDLLLPGTPGAVASMLAGYKPDLLLVFGFNWRLPREVLAMPRLGALNIHPSALPKYRGPSPVPWAIRNGDAFMGLTVHRVTERIDAGPILAQATDLPIPDRATTENIWELTKAALPAVLGPALDAAVHGDPGTPQDEAKATYARMPPPEWYRVTWQGDRHSVHNQIRLLRYLNQGDGPVVAFQGRTVKVQQTSLTQDGGVRIECADGPLWVTCTASG